MAARGVLARLLFETGRGIETARRVSREELGFVDDDRVNYRATGWRTLERLFGGLSISPSDVFIDFGSGKGRVILAAARRPFARVIGVEVSPQLHEIALANLVRSRSRLRCANVDLVCQDVLDYSIPDDVTVAYFFNPFRGEIFASVAQRLAASVERAPRALMIVYINPQEEAALLAAGARLVERIVGKRRDGEVSLAHSIGIYLLEPERRPGVGV